MSVSARSATCCDEFSIGVVTLWTLSDDNIANRSADELDDLYRIDEEIIMKLVADGRWRLHHIGDTALLPEQLAQVLHDAEHATRGHRTSMVSSAR
ncbi:undecaprenyl diphosphate synthase family protein [Streptomyces lavendulae]|uniref:undecaprenyl diphosphate synthase family protein n=1 Tax=Streptomyces lavendulae TaxID=1914 RepID=UPI0036A35B40